MMIFLSCPRIFFLTTFDHLHVPSLTFRCRRWESFPEARYYDVAVDGITTRWSQRASGICKRCWRGARLILRAGQINRDIGDHRYG